MHAVKESFQLRSQRGRPVIGFDNLDRARQEAGLRKLRLFRIVTTEEEIIR